MTTPHRDMVDQLHAWIRDEVPELADARTFREEPQAFETGRCLAVWWEGDAPFDADSTTGWMGLEDAYRIRYWEASDDVSRTLADEDGAARREAIQHSVRRSLFTHTNLNAATLSNAYHMTYVGARKLASSDGAALVRGFEFEVRVRRPEAYA